MFKRLKFTPVAEEQQESDGDMSLGGEGEQEAEVPPTFQTHKASGNFYDSDEESPEVTERKKSAMRQLLAMDAAIGGITFQTEPGLKKLSKRSVEELEMLLLQNQSIVGTHMDVASVQKSLYAIAKALRLGDVMAKKIAEHTFLVTLAHEVIVIQLCKFPAWLAAAFLGGFLVLEAPYENVSLKSVQAQVDERKDRLFETRNRVRKRKRNEQAF